MIRRISGRNILLAGIFWLATAAAGHAQPAGNYLTPPPEAEDPTAHRFQLGLGYHGALALVDPDGLNELARRFGTGGFDLPRYIHGAAGVLRYDGGLEGFLLGAHVLFTSTTRRSPGEAAGIEVERSAHFSMVSFGGELHYVLFEGLTSSFLLGTGIGHDTYAIEMTQARADGEPLDNVVDEEWNMVPPGTSVGRYLKLTAGALVLHPAVSLELRSFDAPTVKTRLSIGYRVVPNAPEWTSASGRAVGDMPRIDMSGLTIGATVSMGIFLQ